MIWKLFLFRARSRNQVELMKPSHENKNSVALLSRFLGPPFNSYSTSLILLCFIFYLSYRYLNSRKSKPDKPDSQSTSPPDPITPNPARALGFRAPSTLSIEDTPCRNIIGDKNNDLNFHNAELVNFEMINNHADLDVRLIEPEAILSAINEEGQQEQEPPQKLNDSIANHDLLDKISPNIHLSVSRKLTVKERPPTIPSPIPLPETNIPKRVAPITPHQHCKSAPEFLSLFRVPIHSISHLSCISLVDLNLECLPVEVGTTLHSLRCLILRHNPITQIPKSISGLKHLQILDLSYNQMESLDDNLFQEMTQLHTLLLAYNKLTCLPSSMGLLYTHLKVLRLEENLFMFPFNIYTLPLMQALGTTSLPQVGTLCELIQDNATDDAINRPLNDTFKTVPLGHGYLLRLLGFLRDLHHLCAVGVKLESDTCSDSAIMLSNSYLQTAETGSVSSETVDGSSSFTSKPDLARRSLVIKELLETEKTYISELELCQTLYLIPLQDEGLSHDELFMLFGNLTKILDYHRSVILPHLKDLDRNISVAQLFLSFIEQLRFYSDYMNNYDRSTWILSQFQPGSYTSTSHESVPRRVVSSASAAPLLLHKYHNSQGSLRRSVLKKIAFVMERAKKDSRHGQLNLGGYLLLPIQRLPRYQLLLEQCLKFTPLDHFDYNDLRLAVSSLKDLIKECNEKKRDHEFQSQIDFVISHIRDPSHYLYAIRSFLGRFKTVYTGLSVVKYLQRCSGSSVSSSQNRLAGLTCFPQESHPFDPLRFTNQKRHKFKQTDICGLSEWVFHSSKESNSDPTTSVKAAREIELGGAIALYGVPRMSGRKATFYVFDNALLWCTQSTTYPSTSSPLRKMNEDTLPKDIDLVRVITLNSPREFNLNGTIIEWHSLASRSCHTNKSILRICNGISLLYLLGSSEEIESLGTTLNNNKS